MVSVLIVTYNSARTLRACLESLAQQDYRPLEVILVDNASTDGTREILSGVEGRYRVLYNQANLGFAAAQNLAIRQASGEWLLSLNPDALLSPAFLARLVAAGEADPRVGSLCGKLLRWKPGGTPERTDVIDSSGIYFRRNLRHLDRGADAHDQGQYDRREFVFGATGAAALFRRAMVEEVSVNGEFFDEEFFCFREDADLAWRAQLLGWRCLYIPEAVGWHVRRVTPARFRELPRFINWHSVKNRFLMRAKNIALPLYRRLFFPVTARDTVILGYCLLVDWRLLSAFWAVWRRRRSLREKRKWIQSRRRVSDRELLRWFSDSPTAFPVEADAPAAETSRALASAQR